MLLWPCASTATTTSMTARRLSAQTQALTMFQAWTALASVRSGDSPCGQCSRHIQQEPVGLNDLAEFRPMGKHPRLFDCMFAMGLKLFHARRQALVMLKTWPVHAFVRLRVLAMLGERTYLIQIGKEGNILRNQQKQKPHITTVVFRRAKPSKTPVFMPEVLLHLPLTKSTLHEHIKSRPISKSELNDIHCVILIKHNKCAWKQALAMQ